ADHPMTVLVIFTCCYWVCMSWMFTQCERYNGKEGSTEYYYMNSLWFIMVTFMSIGYGDVVPTSYCGRLLSITTGIVGAGVSSALIAVISRKLELSRAEKHVNNFMADSKLTNARKNAAASVLQHTWFIHKYQQRNGHKGDEIRLRQHQRRFLNSINEFRRIKWDQRKLQERGNSLLDVGKLHTEMHETLWEMHRTQDQFVGMIEILTQRITELQQTVLNASNIQQQQIYTNNQLFPPNNDRKISKEKQLRVPINNLNNSKKISSNHPQQQKQSNNLFLQTHPSINNSKQNNSIIISGFESNLGLTNSCSSPCLQKSQQQQQTILHKMRVLKDEDECIPLMNDKEMMAYKN
uniref:CaMBD domain-containing protein n=1 Tax=Meloidogyne hapla TaxID=6305 RepID=A0A1I8BJD5_MELHA